MTTKKLKYITKELRWGIVSGHFNPLHSENLLSQDSVSYFPPLKIKGIANRSMQTSC